MDIKYELAHLHGDPLHEDVFLEVKVQGQYGLVIALLEEIRMKFVEIKEEM